MTQQIELHAVLDTLFRICIWGERNSVRKRTNPKQFKTKKFQQNLKNQKCLDVWCGNTNDAHKKPAQKRGVTLLINFNQHMRSYWCFRLYWLGGCTGSAFPWTNSQQWLWSLAVVLQGGGEGALGAAGALGLPGARVCSQGSWGAERCQWRGALSWGRLCSLLSSFPQDIQGSEHPHLGMARAGRAAPFPLEGWDSVWAEFAFISYQRHLSAALALLSEPLRWAGTWNYPKCQFLCSLCSFIDTQILRKLICLWAMFY